MGPILPVKTTTPTVTSEVYLILDGQSLGPGQAGKRPRRCREYNIGLVIVLVAGPTVGPGSNSYRLAWQSHVGGLQAQMLWFI